MTDDTIARIRAISALADVTDPRFTDAQVAKVAEFEAAETPAEVAEAATVRDLAIALSNAACSPEFLDIRWDYIPAEVKNRFWPALASAALAVITTEADR